MSVLNVTTNLTSKASYISARNKWWLYCGWSLTCAAVKLSLFQDNDLSYSMPHRVEMSAVATGPPVDFHIW